VRLKQSAKPVWFRRSKRLLPVAGVLVLIALAVCLQTRNTRGVGGSHPEPSSALPKIAGTVPSGTSNPATTLAIDLKADRTVVDMGRSTVLSASVTRDLAPAAGVELWPYLDDRRWGAQALTDARGHATLVVPLPRPGEARLQVIVAPPRAPAQDHWVWAETTRDNQTVYFSKAFSVTEPVRHATLYVACDDSYRAYLNGREVATGSLRVVPVNGLEQGLRPGRNVLAVEGRNGFGPAGLLARFEMETASGKRVISTDDSWGASGDRPANWPDGAASRGDTVRVIAPAGQGVWRNMLEGWPGVDPQNDFPVGRALPEGAARSNTLRIRVKPRTFPAKRDPEHLVGMEWNVWFTPRNNRWDTAQAVPVLGNYDSFNPDVVRQHCLWMTEAGIDFLLVDWSNNLLGKQRWADRGEDIEELVRATTVLLDVAAQLWQEGIPVPRIVLLLGLENGPATTTAALNEEIRWIDDAYIRNPRNRGLWAEHQGKPLLLVYNGRGPGNLHGQPSADDSRFTLRWMSSQLQQSHLDRHGYWSWMDGTVDPVPTYVRDRVEALTITPAFFGPGGWTDRRASGRRGGATFLQVFAAAMKHRPRFLLINQWNEFMGQRQGEGGGPRHDQYFDAYSAELSNDIEPTAPTLPGYRSQGGWGYYYLNLTRALLEQYHGRAPETTLLCITHPSAAVTAFDRHLPVEWVTLGRKAKSFTLSVDGKEVARGLQGSRFSLPVQGLTPGVHKLKLTADHAVTRFPLSRDREDEPLSSPVPTAGESEFRVK